MTDREYRTQLGATIFASKYAHAGAETWSDMASTLVKSVCYRFDGTPLLDTSTLRHIQYLIATHQFIPAGRYLYYAGRPLKFFNNCFAFRAEDTREGWADLLRKVTSALMAGGGIGVDYSAIRPRGSILSRTGGEASGPLSLMQAVNEIGRQVRQGGSRRSAAWAGLHWRHADIEEFVRIKDWDTPTKNMKLTNYDYPAPLDMTNISVILDHDFFDAYFGGDEHAINLFNLVLRYMFSTGEPGLSVNYADPSESLRNACTEVTACDDSTPCNLGSVNFGKLPTGSVTEAADRAYEIAYYGSQFLLCGTCTGDLPFAEATVVRTRNRDIGLGILGLTEWLMLRGEPYAPSEALRTVLDAWARGAQDGALNAAYSICIRQPRKTRAIAPTGTISLIAGTTSGIEPLFALAVKRRYLRGERWVYQYVIDPTAEWLMNVIGMHPDDLSSKYTAYSIPFETRIAMQAMIQEFVDMGISSTINLPSWGTDTNNEHTLTQYRHTLLQWLPKLRGITCYPDGARYGQPIEVVDYRYALKHRGEYDDLSSEQCKSGACGL